MPPDWVLRLRVGSASTQQVAPLRLTPGYRADRDLPGRGPCTPLEVRVSARDVNLAALDRHAIPNGGDCFLQSRRAVDDEKRRLP